jgi:hypothetical protein
MGLEIRMKATTLSSIVVLLAFLLSSAVQVGCGDDDKDKLPCDPPFTCPVQGTVDCMPVVPPSLEDLCVGECHEWIVENCPAVVFSW